MSDPFDLFFALYVGESLGALEQMPFPRLSAPVRRRTPNVPVEQLGALRVEWSDWWTALLADRSRRESGAVETQARDFGVGAGLRDAQQELLSEARGWRDVNHWNMSEPPKSVPGEVVREIESRIGRRARPFVYSLEVLPVAGAYVHDVSVDRTLISESDCWDRGFLSAILRPRLERLA